MKEDAQNCWCEHRRGQRPLKNPNLRLWSNTSAGERLSGTNSNMDSHQAVLAMHRVQPAGPRWVGPDQAPWRPKTAANQNGASLLVRVGLVRHGGLSPAAGPESLQLKPSAKLAADIWPMHELIRAMHPNHRNRKLTSCLLRFPIIVWALRA